MTLNFNLLGREWTSPVVRWSSKDAIIYALGIGIGADNPAEDLHFTTENSTREGQRVFPTFPLVLTDDFIDKLGDFDLTAVLHAEQALTIHAEVPVAGEAVSTSRVISFNDKGRDAVITVQSEISTVRGEHLATSTQGIFVRGEGGFGGARGSSQPWSTPRRKPDQIVSYRTRNDQALLYRLSGDRNPLHSDPFVAAASGFDSPILHGLCTYAFTARALMASVRPGLEGFGTMSARFTASVLPGELLSVSMWFDGALTLFRTTVDHRIVLDRGVFSPREMV